MGGALQEEELMRSSFVVCASAPFQDVFVDEMPGQVQIGDNSLGDTSVIQWGYIVPSKEKGDSGHEGIQV